MLHQISPQTGAQHRILSNQSTILFIAKTGLSRMGEIRHVWLSK